MSLIDYGRYLNINESELKIYLTSKKQMGRNLAANSNINLLNIIIAMILNKNPAALVNKYGDQHYLIMCNILDNTIGTIELKQNHKKCKICNKNNASHVHLLDSNYNMVNQPILCQGCLQVCIDFSNKCIIELAMPDLFDRYCLFKSTSIFKNLINEINYYIFYLSAQ